MEHEARRVNDAGFEQKHDKNILSLVHGWKIQTLCLKLIFLVLI